MEFKSKSVGQIRKLLGDINEINLDNSLPPARREKPIKRKYCIALKGIVKLYNG